MKKRTRFYYFLTVLIIFIIAAVAIIFYSQGYKYSFSNSKVIKTSSLYLESDPRGATITLDGDLKTKNTPQLFNRLDSTEHTFKVTKDNYFPYNKTFVTNSDEAVYFSDIFLFKSNTQAELAEENIIDYLVLSDERLVYLIQNETNLELILFKGDKKESLKTFELDTSLEFINHDTNKLNHLVIRTQKDSLVNYYNINLDNRETKDLTELVLNNFSKEIILKINNHSDYLYILENKSIYRLDITNNEIQEIVISAKNIQDFFLNGEFIYFVANDGISNTLETVRYEHDQSTPKIVTSLDTSFEYSANTDNNNYFILVDKQNNKTFIISKQNSSLTIETLNLAAKYDWHNNDLLYFSNFEIWHYDLEKNEKNLITRQGETITDAIFHPAMKNIIYSENNKLVAVELEEKFGRFFTDINNTGATDIFITNNGDHLYWLAQEGNYYSLYKKEIR